MTSRDEHADVRSSIDMARDQQGGGLIWICQGSALSNSAVPSQTASCMQAECTRFSATCIESSGLTGGGAEVVFLLEGVRPREPRFDRPGPATWKPASGSSPRELPAEVKSRTGSELLSAVVDLKRGGCCSCCSFWPAKGDAAAAWSAGSFGDSGGSWEACTGCAGVRRQAGCQSKAAL